MQISHQNYQLKFSHSAPFHMKTWVSLKYFVTDCRLKPSTLNISCEVGCSWFVVKEAYGRKPDWLISLSYNGKW